MFKSKIFIITILLGIAVYTLSFNLGYSLISKYIEENPIEINESVIKKDN